MDIADAREDRILVKHPHFQNTNSLHETWVVIYRSTETHWLGYDLDYGCTWEIMAPDGLVTISGEVDMNELRPHIATARILALKNCKWSGSSFSEFCAELENSRSVRALDLSWNSLGEEDGKILGRAIQNTSAPLAVLNLEDWSRRGVW